MFKVPQGLHDSDVFRRQPRWNRLAQVPPPPPPKSRAEESPPTKWLKQPKPLLPQHHGSFISKVYQNFSVPPVCARYNFQITLKQHFIGNGIDRASPDFPPTCILVRLARTSNLFGATLGLVDSSEGSHKSLQPLLVVE